MNKYYKSFLLASFILLLMNAKIVNAIDQYSIIYNIPIGANMPNITSWNNNKTNDNGLIISINVGDIVKFNVVADQPIDSWQWYKDGIIQNNNYDNFGTSWNTPGNKIVSVNGSNINGTTNTIVWTINVASSSISLSSCGGLNKTNSVYVLSSNVSSNGSCFTFMVGNITLDGQGKTANYSMTSSGYGIVDTGGYNNIIIKNLTLVQSSNYTSSYGINFKNVVNSKAENINIVTTGNGVYLLSSNSNIFTKFNILAKSYGIYLSSSNYNNYSDSSIVSIMSNNDYNLQNSTHNNFINTNFTTRKIYYYDNKSNFNYGNSGIWLNTNQNAIPTTSLIITRTLINWNQTSIVWQEKLSASRTLAYGMYGLLPNTNYSIWNGSIISYNLKTDVNGNLPIFNINHTTALRTIKVLY